ncbi:putative damage-inducible protein DinB [Mucilaginibacter oryzae]|uniref:Putative damage-inducible protein DinB n=1 Tax=Mucilaginibacter oryzae TaxID=468058 RepID=A0A316HNW9_9SPHI|nr:DinB family protein [Mucilaginibacter oryzae]PWK76602.1 putative damage-inducible protein DinB [Mucilaginibacter oryzae]
MYYRIKEFLEDWAYEKGRTSKIYAMIPEEYKAVILNEKVRTLERLAFHIPQVMMQIGIQTGLLKGEELAEEPLPPAMSDINALYLDIHAKMAKAVEAQWTDGMLNDEAELYNHQWRRGDILSLLTHHEVHHRSQMTVLMRLAGLEVPELYGPVREDWAFWELPVAK